MAFTVATRTSQESADTTSHTVMLPDGSDVTGVRVVVLAAVDGNSQHPTWPEGWTEFFTGGTTQTSLSAAYRDIDGTEGFGGTDDSITLTTSGSEQSNHHSYLVSDGHDDGTAPEAATGATGGSATPDPPSLTPSWGSEENLWVAVSALRFGDNHTAAPANYTNLLSLNGGDANAPLGSARRILDATTEDPGTFTIADGSSWVTTTLAVRPAAGGEDHSGGSEATVNVTAAGAGSKQADGATAASVDVTAEGGGVTARSAGAAASVDVTAEGGGVTARSGGSEATVAVTPAGAGTAARSGGSTADVTITATGGGTADQPPVTGGSEATVTATALGGGTKYASGGSSTDITITAAGAGTTSREGGTGTTVNVTATGGGTPDEPPVTGGSATTVDVTALGGGVKAATSGSQASVTITAEVLGIAARSGGSEATVLVTANGETASAAPIALSPFRETALAAYRELSIPAYQEAAV